MKRKAMRVVDCETLMLVGVGRGKGAEVEITEVIAGGGIEKKGAEGIELGEYPGGQ